MSARAALPVLPALASLFPSAGVEGGEGDEPGRTVLLAERLGEARIESPLLELEPAADLQDLADPAVDVLLEEPFEGFEFEWAGWVQVPGAEIAETEEGASLRLEGLTARPNFGWVLPVQTDAFYRFSRSVHAEGEPICDFYVVESALEPEDVRLDAGALFLAGRGVALRVHGLPVPARDTDGWQRDSTSFYPTQRTRSLVVILRPRVGIDPGTQRQAMSFDDILLEEVLPDRRERMRLLKGAAPEPGAEDPHGMRKAGWLLPLPSADRVREGEPAESNYDWRRALYAPPTTELAFDLTLPRGARLRLATGLSRETPQDAAARFQLELVDRSSGETARLLDHVRSASTEDWSWEEVDLDLSARAGEDVTLVLRTLAEEGDPHPLWANPRVEAEGAETDPLVILIAVDTLRADRLSAYGYDRETSPSLDRLARDGVRFDQARSNCNWTCPSFASIFTGLVPSRHGVTSYGPATPLPDELVTLAEHFQGAGWATRSIAYKVPLFDGNYEQGFDQAYNVPRDFIRGEENLARALEWLDDHRSGPAFLFLHFNDPHQPFIQPEPYDGSFGPSPGDLGVSTPPAVPGQGQEEMQRLFSDLYDGAISYVDDCIGRFLAALRERELYDRATVAFVADHGEAFWEHGRFGHGGEDLYDEVVRVPLIVKPPAGRWEAGRVVEAGVSGFDVMPTLLELGGIQPAAELDARSLVPLIAGEEPAEERAIVTETSRRGISVFQAGLKYVREPDGTPEMLYDLRADPTERADVARERPEDLERLRELAIAYVLEHRPGRFLLLRADEPTNLRVSTSALRTLFGPAELETGTEATLVRLAAGSFALLEVEDPDGDAVTVEGLPARGPSTGFGPWVAGGLPALSGAGVWRLAGPDTGFVRPDAEAEPEEVDVELLDALRRLGYAE